MHTKNKIINSQFGVKTLAEGSRQDDEPQPQEKDKYYQITAEQSEQMIVRLPAKKDDPGIIAGLASRWAQGWNDCLSEVIRLNTPK